MPNKKNGISFDKIDRGFDISGAKVHFIGIGGISMASLARLSIISGAEVSGSDRYLGENTHILASMGAKIMAGHNSENIPENTDLIVYSNAISESNPELAYAIESGIPAVSRPRFMGAMMQQYRRKIGISGTHGKSTTTAMIDAIFTLAGKNQTTLAGEDIPCVGSALRVGSKDDLIYEACEYKDAFQMFSPTIAVALNMEMDHVDYYKDEKSLKNSFVMALSKATDFALINEDDENLFKIKKRIATKVITFGSNDISDYRYSILSFGDGSYTFSLTKHGKIIGIFKISLMGSFNVINACAAAIVAIECGINVKVIIEALRSFGGVKRRLEPVGNHSGRAVIYDYAHHPTEVRNSINAVRGAYGEGVTVVFKPHTFTRTEYFWREFIQALSMADYVVLTDIYPARENPIFGVTSENLAKAIGPKAIYAKDSEILSVIDHNTYGTIIVMGAGDLADVKRMLVEHE